MLLLISFLKWSVDIYVVSFVCRCDSLGLWGGLAVRYVCVLFIVSLALTPLNFLSGSFYCERCIQFQKSSYVIALALLMFVQL